MKLSIWRENEVRDPIDRNRSLGPHVVILRSTSSSDQTIQCHSQVNLVSEHIWCNDFLVRSFYLKNVQTQETRTLTQFHFLSWPAQGIPTSTRPLLDFRRYCTHRVLQA